MKVTSNQYSQRNAEDRRQVSPLDPGGVLSWADSFIGPCQGEPTHDHSLIQRVDPRDTRCRGVGSVAGASAQQLD